MSETLKRFWPLVLLVVLQIIFLIWPDIDLWFSGLYFVAPEGFYLADRWPIRLLDAVFGNLHWVMLLVLPWLWLASLHWAGKGETSLRCRLVFLLIVVVLAPTVLVSALQTESGRALPVDVVEFGGQKHFSGAFQPAAECHSDCSFVSRHAANGFVLMAFAWVLGARAWMPAAVGLGLLAGLARVAQGEAYLSDVVFAFWVVYGVCAAAAAWALPKHMKVAIR
ncbi:phosphatase PAP2 family protein [Thiosocius teredinicola]|uniref:phosphatase PAP2 family protein n=1 Tax=Thiosocius teredinicola TaxID=1973002 RepID=UPI00099108CD